MEIYRIGIATALAAMHIGCGAGGESAGTAGDLQELVSECTAAPLGEATTAGRFDAPLARVTPAELAAASVSCASATSGASTSTEYVDKAKFSANSAAELAVFAANYSRSKE